MGIATFTEESKGTEQNITNEEGTEETKDTDESSETQSSVAITTVTKEPYCATPTPTKNLTGHDIFDVICGGIATLDTYAQREELIKRRKASTRQLQALKKEIEKKNKHGRLILSEFPCKKTATYAAARHQLDLHMKDRLKKLNRMESAHRKKLAVIDGFLYKTMPEEGIAEYLQYKGVKIVGMTLDEFSALDLALKCAVLMARTVDISRELERLEQEAAAHDDISFILRWSARRDTELRETRHALQNEKDAIVELLKKLTKVNMQHPPHFPRELSGALSPFGGHTHLKKRNITF